jgi:tyrosyl-tRNA synthetase
VSGRASPETQLEVFRAGSVALYSAEDLLAKLREDRPLRIKLGCDPSAPDLHVGHVVQLQKLRDLQELGHQIVFLVGDFTAMIGDPSGRSRTRPSLSADQVRENAETYREQVSAVLDPSRIELRFNSEWMAEMSPADFIRLASHQSVARMLERDDFRTRYQSEVSIAIHEFLYPLVQAYDSVALAADMELGGTDQTFNLLLGREIQRAYGQAPQVVMTLPLLEGIDGSEKMSKSLGNAIGVREPPAEIYGKTMSIPDAILPRWVALLNLPGWGDLAERAAALERGEGSPRDVKAELARRLVERFWGEDAANEAEAHFDRVFRQHGVPEEVPAVRVELLKGQELSVVELLDRTGLAESRNAAKRLVAQGGVRLDEARVDDPQATVAPGEHLVRVGKRRFLRVLVHLA